jgi:hypothetical protein
MASPFSMGLLGMAVEDPASLSPMASLLRKSDPMPLPARTQARHSNPMPPPANQNEMLADAVANSGSFKDWVSEQAQQNMMQGGRPILPWGTRSPITPYLTKNPSPGNMAAVQAMGGLQGLKNWQDPDTLQKGWEASMMSPDNFMETMHKFMTEGPGATGGVGGGGETPADPDPAPQPDPAAFRDELLRRVPALKPGFVDQRLGLTGVRKPITTASPGFIAPPAR